MTVGQTIRALRKKRGLTQAQLGGLCGLTGAMVSGYERGGTLPKEKTLRALAEALGVPVSRLTDEPAAPASVQKSQSDTLLLEGLLEVLKAAYGCAERKAVGGSGETACYYLLGVPPESFVLREKDLLAMAGSAKAALTPLLESIRRRQTRPEELRKLG